MTTGVNQVLRRHDNGCTIRASSAPLFWLECGNCGTAMDLARISTAPDRLHLLCRCPIDRLITALVFARRAGRLRRGHRPVTLLAGPAHAPRARCSCGSEGSFAIVDFIVAHETELSCVLIACGHEFELHLPGRCDLDVEGDDHG